MWKAKNPPAPPPPIDLSHLTDDERSVIQEVLERQKALENETAQIQSSIAKELETYQNRFELRSTSSSNSSFGTVEDDPEALSNMCDVCHKNLIVKTSVKGGANSNERICRYCQSRLCDACSLQVDVGKQVTWSCPICKKKQDMLAKTGKWFHGKEVKRHNPLREIEQSLLQNSSRSNSTSEAPNKTFNSTPAKPTGKLPKTNHSVSAATKARLEEIAEARKRQQAKESEQLGGDSDSSTASTTKIHDNKQLLLKVCEQRDDNNLLSSGNLSSSGYLSNSFGASGSDSESVDGSPLLRRRGYMSNAVSTVNDLSPNHSPIQRTKNESGSADSSPGRKKRVTFDEKEPVQMRSPLLEQRNSPNEGLESPEKLLSSHHVSWSPPDEENKQLGDILLTIDCNNSKMFSDHCSAFGFRIAGGYRGEGNKLKTVITAITEGGIASTIAQLKIGDEILEWNEQSFVDCTQDEVEEIISIDDSLDLHIVVVRDCSRTPAAKSDQKLETNSSVQLIVVTSAFSSYSSPAALANAVTSSFDLMTSSTSTSSQPPAKKGILKSPEITSSSGADDKPMVNPFDMERNLAKKKKTTRDEKLSPCNFPGFPNIVGQLQIKLNFDKETSNLYVTVAGAEGLSFRPTGNQPRNPYVKLYFLPDRSLQSKRRTKTVLRSVSPRWNQTFMYATKQQKVYFNLN